MGHDGKGSSGVVCVVSKQAGTVAGTSVVIGKKIADCGVKSVTAAKDCLTRPLKILMSSKDKYSSITSEALSCKTSDRQETRRKKAAKALIASLESDLSAAKHELEEAQSNAEEAKSKLTSQLSELKAEKESLISDLEQAKNQADKAAVHEAEVSMQIAALESDLTTAQEQLEMTDEEVMPEPPAELDIVVEEVEEKAKSAKESTDAELEEELGVESEEQQPSEAIADIEMPQYGAVTDKQIKAAVFPNITDKIIFKSALTDILNEDTTVRADAVRTLAGIRHELSVNALVVHMESEPSSLVRQECVKSLVALEDKQAVAAVKCALKDRAASVRLAAVWGLYRLDGEENASALTQMLGDADEEVRRRAAICISWLGKEELATELLSLLSDKSVPVRQAAAEAMGNLRNRKVVSTLIERLNDPDKATRKVFLKAIEKITAKKLSKSYPKSDAEFERLVVRWRQWWKDELLG